MTTQAVMEFWQHTQESPELQGKVRSAIEGRNADQAIAMLVEVGGRAGHEFTAEDYENARQEIPRLLAGDDQVQGFMLSSYALIGSRLISAGGALHPGGVLRRNGVLNRGGLVASSDPTPPTLEYPR